MRRPTEAFFRGLGLTLLGLVGEDLMNGAWAVHSGAFYPYRHITAVPLYPPAGLLVEWLLLAACGLAILLGRRRDPAILLAAAVTLISLTQRFSNHKSLLLIVLAFLALDRVAEGPARDERPGLDLVRGQLVIVYLFSAVHKIRAGFLTGESLTNLASGLHASPLPAALRSQVQGSVAEALSWATVLLELTIPLALWLRPRLGLTLALLLHLAFTVAMPGLFAFGLLMVSMACLWQPGEGSPARSPSSGDTQRQEEQRAASKSDQQPRRGGMPQDGDQPPNEGHEQRPPPREDER